MNQILISAEQIQVRVREMAQQFRMQPNTVFLGVLNGGVFFATDFLKALPYPVVLDFIQADSYDGTKRKDKVTLTKEPKVSVTNANLVFLEDIIDSGNTTAFLCEWARANQIASVSILALLARKSSDTTRIPLKDVGFWIEDEFVIGYGLDYKNQYRNLPYIAVYSQD